MSKQPLKKLIKKLAKTNSSNPQSERGSDVDYFHFQTALICWFYSLLCLLVNRLLLPELAAELKGSEAVLIRMNVLMTLFACQGIHAIFKNAQEEGPGQGFLVALYSLSFLAIYSHLWFILPAEEMRWLTFWITLLLLLSFRGARR